MSVAYQGLDYSGTDLDPLITAWISKALSAPSSPYVEQRQLAEAMLDRYGGVPSESQWNTDPIISRLAPDRTRAIHDHVLDLTAEARANRQTAGR